MKKHVVLLLSNGDVATLHLHACLKNLGYEIIVVANCSYETIKTIAQRKPEILVTDPLRYATNEHAAITEKLSSKLKIPVVFITALVRTAQQNHSDKHQEKVLDVQLFMLKSLEELDIDLAICNAIAAHGIIEKQDVKILHAVVIPNDNSKLTTKRDTEKALEFIKKVSPFSNLSEAVLTDFVRNSHFSHAQSGDYITFEGNDSDASFIVVSGRIAMTKTSINGKDLVVKLLAPLDTFGVILAIEHLPEQLSSRAQCESEVLWIPTSALLSLIANYPEIRTAFLRHMSDDMRSSHNLLRGLAHDNVEVRIASLLLQLVEQFPRFESIGGSGISIDITRQQVADLIGTTPETTSRVTRTMNRMGILDINTLGTIQVLDLGALKELILSH